MDHAKGYSPYFTCLTKEIEIFSGYKTYKKDHFPAFLTAP